MKYKITTLFIIGIILIGCDGSPKSGRTPQNKNQKKEVKTSKKKTAIDEDTSINLGHSDHLAVNVYIENSSSMDGYVGNSKTDFKTTVYSYLSDIKISGITDSLNLHYINTEIIPHKPDISDFIEKLNPKSFKIKGGHRGTTDISNLISTIITETGETTISILISDFIFSPGKNKDADQYLINQQIGIKTKVAEVLKYRDLGIIVYQLSSEFKGNYYNRENKITVIDDRRPFYIWIIGDKKYVAKLHSEIPMSKFKGKGVENVFTIIKGNQKVDYAIRPGTGKFNLDRENPNNKIIKAKKDHNGELTFAVNVDFSKLLLDDEYLKDVYNYTISDKDYQLQITKSPSNANNFTLSLNFTSNRIKPSNLSVKLNMFVPQWVEKMNDDEGLNINANGAINKTYGIKYLINGVYEAFTQKQDFYTEIKISINK